MFIRFILIVAIFSVPFVSAAEEAETDWNTTTLTGDWGGTRTNLFNHGVDLGFTHKSDFLSNLSGGLKQGTVWMGHTEVRARMNLEKIMSWDNTSAFILFHNDLGSKFNRDYVGAFGGVDNIETTVNTGQFFNAWVQKNSSDNRLSVLAGLYPIDEEFYVTDASAIFTEPPYGMANEVIQSNYNAPQAAPVFPTAALAIRLKYIAPSKSFYSQYAIFDGVPGDPNNPSGTHIQLNKGDGTLSIAEFGYTPQTVDENSDSIQPSGTRESETQGAEERESFNKTALGIWHYSAQFKDFIDVDSLGHPVRRSSQGIYFLAERTLMTENKHPSHGLSGFFRFGTASPDIHQSDKTGSLGLRYHGLIAGRGDDIAGIAITINHASDKFRLLNNNAYSNQTNMEATYRAQIKPWFALQPSLQYILHPNMDRTLRNVWIISTRAEINF